MVCVRTVVNFVLLVVILIGSSGCGLFQKEKPPLAPPAASLSLQHYAGSVLSGPQPRTVDESALKKSWQLNIDLVATTRLPSHDFNRIASQAKLILATRNGVPMSSSSEIGSTSLIRSVESDFDRNSLFDDPKSFAVMTSQTAGVAPGSSVQFQLSTELAANTMGRRSITIRIGRGNDGNEYELAIIADDIGADNSIDSVDTSEIIWHGVPKQETIYLTPALPGDHERLLLSIPKQFSGSGAQGVLVDLTIQKSPGQEQLDALAAVMQKSIADSSALALKRIDSVSIGNAEEIGLSIALSSLMRAGDSPRGALAYLAGESGAKLSNSIILVADDAQLQLLAKSIVERSAQLQKRDRTSVAWLLDRTTIATLAALANDQAHPLSQAVYGALSSYAGDVGRQIDALQSIAAQSSGPAEMQVRIVGEQMILLEDSSPSARVRAFDWLRTQGLAPAGYDPLAPIKQRREALQKAQTATTQSVVQQ